MQRNIAFFSFAFLTAISLTVNSANAQWWNTQWHYRLPVTAAANGYTRTNKVVNFPVNFTSLLSSLGSSSPLNDQSVRVIEVDGSGTVIDQNVVFQFDHDQNYNASTNASGTVAIMMSGTTNSGATRYFHIYFDIGSGFTLPTFSSQLTLTDNVFYAGQSSYRIDNQLGTLWYHKIGGGFAGMRDLNNVEWIGFDPTPGSHGAGEYRGIPNMGPYAHPGYGNGSSTILSQGPIKVTIKTVTTDGSNGIWIWEFYPTYQTMTLQQTSVNYWLLYEGIPNGTLDQTNGYWKNSQSESGNLGTVFTHDLPGPEWTYFGTSGQQRFMFLAHHENDGIVDHYRPFFDVGAMTILGFGRDGSSVNHYLSETPAHLTFGFGENESQSAQIMDNAFRDLLTTTGTAEANLNGPAQITGQPTDKTVPSGQTATFTVTAVGTAPLTYVWQRNNTDIGAPNSSSYTTPVSSSADSGATFRCIVSNSLATATSNAAILHVTPPPPPPSSTIASDDFNTSQLNLATWVYEDPLGDGSQGMTGTALSISVPAGVSHDIYTNENRAPRVLQNITNITDFDIEAKFDTPMNSAYQLEGVVVEQDASNLLRFGFHTDGSSIFVGGYSISSNIASSMISGTVGSAGLAPLYMRLTRATDTWTLKYSTDGTNWTTAGSFVHALTATAIGPFAGNAGGSPPAFTAHIDYFNNLSVAPVQLARFTATLQNTNAVRLDWTTVSETNNYGFEVEKASGNSNNFHIIPNSFVSGHGTTLEPHHYVFVDALTSGRVWDYRLRQIDLDGTINYSEAVQISTLSGVHMKSLPTEFGLSQNYPNPFNPTTMIDYALPKESNVRLEVYNLIGQKVATLVERVQEAGFHSAAFDASSLGSGLYFYKLSAGETSFTKKMMLLR